MQSRIPKILVVTVAASLTLALVMPRTAIAAGGSSSSTSSQSAGVPRDPKMMARDSYSRALKYRDKAWEYEAKAEAGREADRAKNSKKAKKEYQKALKALKSAVSNDPSLYQAHSSLGYVLRKTGDYESSLAAYNRALQINPRYAEAIEYRAEAYLGLNRIDDAKSAYMELFRTDRKRADELIDSMQEWVDARQSGSGGVDAGVVAEFSGWVAERLDLATQMSGSSGGSW